MRLLVPRELHRQFLFVSNCPTLEHTIYKSMIAVALWVPSTIGSHNILYGIGNFLLFIFELLPLEIQFVYLFNFCKREWDCQCLLSSINNWLGSQRIDMSHIIWIWTWVQRITFLLLTVLSYLDPFDYIYIYTPYYSIYHPI